MNFTNQKNKKQTTDVKKCDLCGKIKDDITTDTYLDGRDGKVKESNICRECIVEVILYID